MQIKFCGAARQVTGSSHLITLDDGYKILLDCGLFQGKGRQTWDDNNKWFFDPRDIDCLILSHAHIDHTGRVPQLVKDGFKGSIYCTHATRSLCAIMLLDSAKIQERDVEYHNRRVSKKRSKKGSSQKLRRPLYTSKEIGPTMSLFVGYSYEKWFHVHPDVEVLFRDAGHILGSASITLRIRQGDDVLSVGFTGDIGRPERPILRNPIPMPEVDYLICESTYGDKEHDLPPEQTEKFLRCITKTCIVNKGKLIIPAFSVGRTQEIIYMMDKLESQGRLPKVPIYVDSPLAVNATQVFGSHPECFDNDLNEYLLIDKDPFGFNSLKYIRDVSSSKRLNNSKKPCVIISASGMMNAGRIRHHMFNHIEKDNTTFLIVGYCSPNTAGSMLKNGIKELKLFGEMKSVNASIETMDSFSAHGDRNEMVDFLNNQQGFVRELFLTHGEYPTQLKFKDFLNQKGFNSITIPNMGQGFQLKDEKPGD